jgi:hypothetical protein
VTGLTSHLDDIHLAADRAVREVRTDYMKVRRFIKRWEPRECPDDFGYQGRR